LKCCQVAQSELPLIPTVKAKKYTMKLNKLSITALAIAALATTSHAATVISYSYYTASGSNDTSWVSPVGSTSVKAVNFGGGETTFGGVTWRVGNQGSATYNDTAPVGLWLSAPNKAWANNHGDFYNDGTALFEEGAWTGSTSADGVDFTLDMAGFTIGQEYLVQFIVADSRGGSGGRTMQIDGYSSNIVNQDSAVYQYAFADSRYAVVTARFVANEQNFQFRPLAAGSLQLNGVQILTIPETSTTLLGGLGALALLRRRRK
jgi:hypothetical protein